MPGHLQINIPKNGRYLRLLAQAQKNESSGPHASSALRLKVRAIKRASPSESCLAFGTGNLVVFVYYLMQIGNLFRDEHLLASQLSTAIDMLGQNTRASHSFDAKVLFKNKKFALIEWQRIKPATDWHELSDGCYL